MRPRRFAAVRVGRVLPHLAALAVIVLTVSLGNWQMRRAAEKAAVQGRIDAALAAPPEPVSSDRPLTRSAIGRQVSVTGRWLDRYTLFVDNRTWRGRAGFHVLTPIRIEASEQVVLVLRGWVPSDPANRTRLPDLQRPGQPLVTLVASVEDDLAQTLELSRSPPPGPADRLWQNASVDRFAEWSGLPVVRVLLRQTDGDPSDGLVRDWPAPGTGVAKHHGYAFQWYALAVLTLGLWMVLTIRRGFEKRR